jgi:hypothetical protein
MEGSVQAHPDSGQKKSGKPIVGFRFFAAQDHRANIKVRLRPILFTPYFI